MKIIYNVLKLFILGVTLTSLLIAAENVNLKSPESLINSFVSALKAGNPIIAGKCFDPEIKNFYLPKPVSISKFKIIKKVYYSIREVQEWQKKKIKPNAKVGDIELIVHIFQGEIVDKYTFLVRKINNNWFIVSHSSWAVQ